MQQLDPEHAEGNADEDADGGEGEAFDDEKLEDLGFDCADGAKHAEGSAAFGDAHAEGGEDDEHGGEHGNGSAEVAEDLDAAEIFFEFAGVFAAHAEAEIWIERGQSVGPALLEGVKVYALAEENADSGDEGRTVFLGQMLEGFDGDVNGCPAAGEEFRLMDDADDLDRNRMDAGEHYGVAGGDAEPFGGDLIDDSDVAVGCVEPMSIGQVERIDAGIVGPADADEIDADLVGGNSAGGDVVGIFLRGSGARGAVERAAGFEAADDLAHGGVGGEILDQSFRDEALQIVGGGNHGVKRAHVAVEEGQGGSLERFVSAGDGDDEADGERDGRDGEQHPHFADFEGREGQAEKEHGFI